MNRQAMEGIHGLGERIDRGVNSIVERTGLTKLEVLKHVESHIISAIDREEEAAAPPSPSTKVAELQASGETVNDDPPGTPGDSSEMNQDGGYTPERGLGNPEE